MMENRAVIGAVLAVLGCTAFLVAVPLEGGVDVFAVVSGIAAIGAFALAEFDA